MPLRPVHPPPRPLARPAATGGRPVGVRDTSGDVAYATLGSALISSYPTALDTAPTLVDSASPMVAQWLNLLQSIIEAVQAEIGPIPVGMTRSNMPGSSVDTLQKLLGQQTDVTGLASGKSYAGLCSATTGNGKPAGTLYGVQKVRVTRSSWTQYVDYTTTITNPFGPAPSWKRPIAWGVPIQLPAGASFTTHFNSGAAKIVAGVDSTSRSTTSETFTVRYAAVTSHSTATDFTPSGSWTFDICLLYMTTEDDQ